MDLKVPGKHGKNSLDVFDFGVLLQALAQSQKEGTLRVVSGKREKLISLKAGRVEAIYTPRSRYQIGRILYNLHAVELPELKAVLAEAREEDDHRHMGEILFDRGLVTADDLKVALEYQMVEEILEVFRWKSVSYEFFRGSPEVALADRTQRLTRVGGSQNAHGILLQVSKVLDDLRKYNQSTPSLRDVYEISGDPETFLEGREDDVTLRDTLDQIDGLRDMGEVIRATRLNRFEAMEHLYRLREAGIIRPKNSFELFMAAESKRGELPAKKRARLYERVAELGVDGFDISLRRAQAYEELHESEAAADDYLAHARTREQANDLEAAEQGALQAIRACPDRTESHEYRARILERLHRRNEMVQEILEAARLHEEQGKPGRADRLLATVLEKYPDEDRLLKARFEVLHSQDKFRRAKQLALRLCRVREANRDLNGARRILERAVASAPRAYKLTRELADLLARSGDAEGASRALGALVPPTLEMATRKPGRALRILGRIHDRLQALEAAGSEAMEAVGTALLRLARTDRALEILGKVGEARIAAGDWVGARDVYAVASHAAPEDLDLAETLALVNARLGSREAALARLRRIGAHHRKEGHLDKAERAYREMLRLNPFSPVALLETARLKADQGDRKQAAARLHELGVLHRTAGDLEEAVPHLEEACRLDPARPEYVRSLAGCLAKALDAKHSLEAYDQLLAMLRARRDMPGSLDVAFRILEVNPAHAVAAQTVEEVRDHLVSWKPSAS